MEAGSHGGCHSGGSSACGTSPDLSDLEVGPAEQEDRSRTGGVKPLPHGPGWVRDVFHFPSSIRVLQEATLVQAAVKMDEPELIRAAQQGDQRAFEQLVRLYDQSVLRLATNLLRSPEDANDIYQEAF